MIKQGAVGRVVAEPMRKHAEVALGDLRGKKNAHAMGEGNGLFGGRQISNDAQRYRGVLLAQCATQGNATQPRQPMFGQYYIDCVVLQKSQRVIGLCRMSHHLPVLQMRHKCMDSGDNQRLCMHNQELYLDHLASFA
jgi:hypothetical protein